MNTTRAIDLDKGFEDGDYLYDIRKNLINKLAERVSESKRKIDETYPLAKQAFTHFDLPDPDEKIITFHSDTGEFPLDLKPLIPDVVIPDFVYPIQRENGSSINDIQTLKIGKGIEIAESHPNTGSGGTLELTVPSPWAKIGAGAYTPVKNFTIIDPNNKVSITDDTLTWTIPKDYGQFMGQVNGDTEQPVKKIKIAGDTTKAVILDEVMTITIPAEGSGGGTVTAEGYFRGFFDNLGEVESQVKNPTSGKTFVFVKDQLVDKGQYYNAYFYVNKAWTEVPTDPAITYTPTDSPLAQGVFTIKPDARINIDAKGQLDLSGLATDEARLDFHGFYETQEQLTAAVPTPIVDKSFGYIKHPNGAWVGKVYRHTDSGNTWQVMAPVGAISLMNDSSGTSSPAPVYGIAKNDDWEMHSNGILSLKAKDSELKVDISNSSGTVESGSFKTIEFTKGKSLASLDSSAKKLTLQHPQRVIQYDSSFETNHNSQDYEGNIYYDETSRCWMGWGVPKDPGGVDVKWTRIAHPRMSDEVKDLSKRLPVKAPYIDPGVLGDAAGWRYTGWSYVRKDDNQLPADFKERCGAYVSTVIQDVPNDTARPQERLQICYADEQGGHCYVRTWNKGASSGSSDYGWRPWVKISMSAKDINDHNVDHTAHRESFKFYKVGTLDMSWATLKTKNGVIGDSDLLLLADSDGVSVDGASTITVPYTGSYRFSGRIDFDGLPPSGSIYPKPNFIIYVYKTVNSVTSIVSEHAYNHSDHTKPVLPLQWKSGEIQLNEGDKIHFELKDFKNSLDSLSGLRFIPNRNFFIMEDYRTTAGSRIAETFRRTMGSLNAHYNVGVNVHYNSGDTGAIRVYGAAVTAKATAMTKVKG